MKLHLTKVKINLLLDALADSRPYVNLGVAEMSHACAAGVSDQIVHVGLQATGEGLTPWAFVNISFTVAACK